MDRVYTWLGGGGGGGNVMETTISGTMEPKSVRTLGAKSLELLHEVAAQVCEQTQLHDNFQQPDLFIWLLKTTRFIHLVVENNQIYSSGC